MGIRIGSFNVRNLSKNNGVNIEAIARIIKAARLDIVALQEVLDAGKIIDGGLGRRVRGEAVGYEHCLLSYLPGYQMRWGASNVKKNSTTEDADKRGEGYAFLWNTKRVELATHITPSGEQVFNPRIWGQYSLIRADGVKRLKRDPFYGRFKIRGMKHEIRLITTHIYFGSNNSSDINLRKKELNILAGAIYPRLHDKRYGVNTPSITVLLGDYNLNLTDQIAAIVVDENGYVHSGNDVKIDKNVRTFTTCQSDPSTLKKSEQGYSNNYDHFTAENSIGGNRKAYDSGSLVYPHAIKVNELIKDIDFETYRSKVSDHLPICVELSFR